MYTNEPYQNKNKRNESTVWNHLYGDTVEPHKPVVVTTMKVGDCLNIQEKDHLEKEYTPNWIEEVFEIVDIQNTNPVTYKIKDLNGEPVDGSFNEPELQKTSHDVFRIEKVIWRKGQRAFVKCKEYPKTLTVGWTTSPLLDEIYDGLP